MRFELSAAMDLLRRTPATLRALLDGVGDDWAGSREGPRTFSPFDVVGHLIDGEETDWIPRARIILARGPDPRFEPYDRFRHQGRNAGRTLDSLLTEFAELRAANLSLLGTWRLGEAELDLPGNHPSLGAVTLRQLLAAWVVHDLGHLAQVSRVMAKQYRDEVGPWVPYLPVLTDHETPRS
jgi:DinB superfamily